MTRTHKQPWKQWHGFAVEIQPDTELGMAMLIAEYDTGAYEPIAVVATINEARQIASHNLACRMRRLERREDVTCPETYKVWAPGLEGRYLTVPLAIA